ncbi:polyphosphate kinase 2 [Limimaricola cinnabarinus]|jgi:polyphosphate kinase 2|uniref:ADP/GDP-polyphosphate phosphotransferase n=1 Tax=Limimaricola cinnabarinus TaxID=1125964 RepID=A0A2G1MK61_9RHOB|nr:polyphosphate kinase 2 [Limimaricola cinnabarinus]PHP29010.1 polyphosphate kinase 2 [Limimaricola cinnabarinus]
MTKPFDAAISRFHEEEAPEEIRRALAGAGKGDIASPRFPYPEKWKRKAYDAEMDALQIELVKMQAWVKETGQRVVVIFEGRDAAGKGGTIARFRQNLNPRGARVVALAKPSEIEAGQWYFQRYVRELPTAGEIVFFDRSWYNRAVVEPVFGFADEDQVARFYDQLAPFEKMLTDDGILLFKLWINVGRATQLERFLKRENDPLKQWKLSWVDVEGLRKWDAYTDRIATMFERSDFDFAPWTVVRGDDKRRARVSAIRRVLSGLDYPDKDDRAACAIDPKIAGGPDIWPRD